MLTKSKIQKIQKPMPIYPNVSLPVVTCNKVGVHYCRFLDGDSSWYEKHHFPNRVERF